MDYRRFHMPDFNAVSPRDYWLAALSGALLAFSFPTPGLAFLAWISFVPLLLAVGKKSPAKAFRLGMVTGVISFGGIVYWLNITMITYGKLHWSVSVCLYLIFVLYLSLFVAAPMWLMRQGEAAGVSSLVSFPVLWIGFEYLRSFFLTGFPWASLGYSQYRFLSLIQIADIAGVYGPGFLLVLANIVIYRLIRGLAGRDKKPHPGICVMTLVILLSLTLWYGFQRLKTPENGTPVKVALIQGNISQDVKWDPAFQEATVAIYERLSREKAARGADLVVWPESAAPFYFQEDFKFSPRIRSLARELQSSMVIGSPAYEKEGDLIRNLNSAFLLNPNGDTVGRSDKIHLVPFGEYVPLARFLPFVHKLVTGIGDFSPGAKATPLNIGKGPIGVLICFEGIFPELSRAYVNAGSRLLVNISNDAWYKRSSAPYQHLSMTVFRAVENRVPLVRATNTGISAVIDAKGHIRATTPLFEEAVLADQVRLGSGGTIYDRFGDIFARICLGLTLLMVIMSLAMKRKR